MTIAFGDFKKASLFSMKFLTNYNKFLMNYNNFLMDGNEKQ